MAVTAMHLTLETTSATLPNVIARPTNPPKPKLTVPLTERQVTRDGLSPTPNPSVKGTAEKLRFSVPSALWAPAAPYLQYKGFPTKIKDEVADGVSLLFSRSA